MSGDGHVAATPVVYNIKQWLTDNEHFFLPPICNKMMHKDGQLKVFFVGGPNVRKDYHIERGEEFFYMRKGDMCLKVVEQGRHKDVHIKQGQVFLLPGCIPHSPQRKEDTVGLVIERDREEEEMDGLRYFVENDGTTTTEILYEKWFHCIDLGPQLSAAVKEYFQTEQYKTGKVIPGTITDDPPVTIDSKVKLQDPFDLDQWINDNRSRIHSDGQVPLFGDGHQFQIMVQGEGDHTDVQELCEVFLWQIEGSSRVTTYGNNRLHILSEGDTMLIPTGLQYTRTANNKSVCMVIAQHKSFLATQ